MQHFKRRPRIARRAFRTLALAATLPVLAPALTSAPTSAQVTDAGFVPRHNLFDPHVAYAAYAFDDADMAALRADLWGSAWGVTLLGGMQFVDGADNGVQAAGVLMRQLQAHANCFGAACVGIQLQAGAALTRRDGVSVVEAPAALGLIQRFSVPRLGVFPGVVGHGWASGSVVGRWADNLDEVGWGLGLGLRTTFHGALAPWGAHVFGGWRWFDGPVDRKLELGIHRVLKRI
ncbi:MAG: hypothetical protein WEA24_13490 [Gemmatimonadota bacterium]